MNMFKAVKATSIKEYLALLPDDRRESIQAIAKLIKKTSPKLKAHFAANMLGYGSFKYKNNKKETLDWPVISLASQKNYISLYICAVNKDGYLAEQFKDELGKVSVGRSCIRFKKIEDLNLKALTKIIKLSEKFPGLSKN